MLCALVVPRRPERAAGRESKRARFLAQLGPKFYTTPTTRYPGIARQPRRAREWAADFFSKRYGRPFRWRETQVHLAPAYAPHQQDRKVQAAENQDETEKLEVGCCKTLAYVYFVSSMNDRHLKVYFPTILCPYFSFQNIKMGPSHPRCSNHQIEGIHTPSRFKSIIVPERSCLPMAPLQDDKE
jgi:hypothetical protein